MKPVAYLRKSSKTGEVRFSETPMHDSTFNRTNWDEQPLVTLSAANAAIEAERLRFEGDLDRWMETIGAGISGYQPEAYAVMDAACEELVRLRERAASLEAMVVEAGKALEPFSDIATTEEEVGRDDTDDDRVMVVQAHGCQLAELLVDHFRAARSIAAKIGVKDA